MEYNERTGQIIIAAIIVLGFVFGIWFGYDVMSDLIDNGKVR